MKKYSMSKICLALAIAVMPFALEAQKLATVPKKPAAGKLAPGLPEPPKPPHGKPGKEDGPRPEPELQKLSVLSGTLVKPVANDRAEYNAFLMKTSGQEVLVKFAPHLGEQIIGNRKEGASMKVTGFYRTNPEGKKEFQMVSAEVDGTTITNTPPVPPPPAASDSTNQPKQQTISGNIQSLRYTLKKDISGFVLSSGENVVIPPHIGQQLANTLKAGEQVTVNGFLEPKISGVVYSENLKFFKAQTIIVKGQSYLIR